MSHDPNARTSRRQLSELLGLAPCPAPAPHLFKAIVDSAPQARPAAGWRRPRFALALTAALLVVAVSFHAWRSANEDSELADVDELAAASLLVL